MLFDKRRLYNDIWIALKRAVSPNVSIVLQYLHGAIYVAYEATDNVEDNPYVRSKCVSVLVNTDHRPTLFDDANGVPEQDQTIDLVIMMSGDKASDLVLHFLIAKRRDFISLKEKARLCLDLDLRHSAHIDNQLDVERIH